MAEIQSNSRMEMRVGDTAELAPKQNGTSIMKETDDAKQERANNPREDASSFSKRTSDGSVASDSDTLNTDFDTLSHSSSSRSSSSMVEGDFGVTSDDETQLKCHNDSSHGITVGSLSSSPSSSEDEEDDDCLLEREAHLLTGITDLNLSSDARAQKKVQFNLEDTLFHQGTHMAKAERSRCFYDQMDLQRFQVDLKVSSRKVLSSHRQEQDQQRRQQMQQGFFSSFFSASSSSLLSDDYHSSSATTKTPSECLQSAYQTCCRAKSEPAMEKASALVHKEELQYLYERDCNQDLPGLEHLVTEDMRGSSRDLTRFVLDHYSFLTERSPCNFSRGSELLAHVSQSVSRPSRLLAYEMALAQQKALADIKGTTPEI